MKKHHQLLLLAIATDACCSIHESLSVILGHAHGGHRHNEP